MNWSEMSFDERLAFIDKHASRIPVRVHYDGGWKSLCLTELPPKLRAFESNRLAHRDAEPVRMRDDV